ncbi:MAG: peptidyl-prolyl cis-trans isomerase [Deltaproteobacteria bacterium]|nr:peptidyl-prolyl cis-trans isomerase [Deltaproteobacteria bacterium]
MRSVMQSLVDQTILSLEAEKMGFSASNEEVADSIKRSGAFIYGGQFHRDRMLNYLRREGISLEEYEESIRFKLAGSKLAYLLQSSVHVTEDELWTKYKAEAEKVAVKAVQISGESSGFDPASLTDEELRAAFDAETESYRLPERRKLVYVALDMKDHMDAAAPDEAAILAEYEKNRDRYKNAEGGTKPLDDVRDEILLQLQARAAREEMERETRRLYEDVAPGTDLREYAASQGLAVSETALFALTDGAPGMEKGVQIAQAAFQMSLNEIAEPVAGYTRSYLFQLAEIAPSEVPSFENARERVVERVSAQRKRDAAVTRAAELLAQLQTGAKTLDDAAKELGTEVVDTGLFSAGAMSVPKLGAVEGLVAAAFGVADVGGYVDAPLPTANGALIFQVTDRQEAARASFDAERTEIENEAMAEKANRFLSEWIDARRDGYPIVENQEFWSRVAQAALPEES